MLQDTNDKQCAYEWYEDNNDDANREEKIKGLLESFDDEVFDYYKPRIYQQVNPLCQQINAILFDTGMYIDEWDANINTIEASLNWMKDNHDCHLSKEDGCQTCDTIAQIKSLLKKLYAK